MSDYGVFWICLSAFASVTITMLAVDNIWSNYIEYLKARDTKDQEQ